MLNKLITKFRLITKLTASFFINVFFFINAVFFINFILLKNSIAAEIENYRIADSKEAPNIKFYDENFKNFNLYDYRGKIVIINFWATWSLQCADQLPQLENLQQVIGKDKLAILPISIDYKDKKLLTEFYKKYNINFPIYTDLKNRSYNAFGGKSIPVSFIMDKTMRKVAIIDGNFKWDDEEVYAFINELYQVQ